MQVFVLDCPTSKRIKSLNKAAAKTLTPALKCAYSLTDVRRFLFSQRKTQASQHTSYLGQHRWTPRFPRANHFLDMAAPPSVNLTAQQMIYSDIGDYADRNDIIELLNRDLAPYAANGVMYYRYRIEVSPDYLVIPEQGCARL